MGKISNFIKQNPILFSFFTMILVLILIYLPLVTGGIWLKWDVYDAAFPLSVSISDSLKHGQLPLWEPFSFRGVPLSHLIGVSVWSPLTLLLGFFGFTQYVIQIQYIILVLLAGIFMYISLIDLVRNPWLAMIGGIAYATCGQFVSNAQHVTFLLPMAIFPLIHYSFRKCILDNNYKWGILLGVGFGLLILNNYPPFLFMSALFLLFEYSINFNKKFLMGKVFLAQLKTIVLAVIIACLTGLVSIYTTFEIISHITRSHLPYEMATGSSLNHWYWFGSLTPALTQILHATRFDINLSMTNVYISLPILLLALVRKPIKRFEYSMFILLIVSIFTVLGSYGPIYKLYYELLPSISSFKFPAGFRYFYFYYVTLLGIYNFYIIRNNKDSIELMNLRNILKWVSYIFLLLLAFISCLYIFNISSTPIPRYTVSEIMVTLTSLVIIIQSFSKFQKWTLPLISVSVIIFCFIGVFRNIEFTIGTTERPPSYQKEIETIYSNKAPQEINNFFIDESPVTMSHTIFTREFQTGGYIGSFELDKFKEARENNMLPEKSDPVVYYINEEKASINENSLLDVSNSNDFKEYQEKILYSPNKFNIYIENSKTGYVVLQQTYFEGWHAKINNREAKIVELTDGTMGVKVSPGTTNILFEFKPKTTIITAWISIISWFVLLVYAIVIGYKLIQRKPKKEKIHEII